MSEYLTLVEIAFYPEYINHWLRFGEADAWQDLDRRRAIAFFKPGRLFGYVRWEANEYGTQSRRLTVAKSCKPQKLLSRIPGVIPGGEVHLVVSGSTRIKRALLQFDAIEASGLDPADVSPAYYRHLHNRILVGKPIRSYSLEQHQAYLSARKRVS